MNNDFICNPMYDTEIFEKVWSMRELPNWNQIDAFIGKKYLMKWIRYKQSTSHDKQKSLSAKEHIFADKLILAPIQCRIDK